jgi:uncharacterized protein YciW
MRMLLLSLVLLLAACSTRSPQETGTIGALAAEASTRAQAEPRPEPQPPAKATSRRGSAGSEDRRKAITAYQRFLDQAPSSEQRAEAMRRLADLQLEEAEALAEIQPEQLE